MFFFTMNFIHNRVRSTAKKLAENSFHVSLKVEETACIPTYSLSLNIGIIREEKSQGGKLFQFSRTNDHDYAN